MRLAGVFAALALGINAAAADPTALVRVATAKRGALAPQITAYGVVAADANYQVTIPMPHDSRIRAVGVHAGAMVEKGQVLLTMETSPAATLTYAQAVSAADFAATDLAHTQRLYAEHLATQSQLATAQKAYSDAMVALKQQKRIGADRAVDTLVAPARGVVVMLNASPGDAVQAGTVVATLADRDHLSVNVGVEPSAGPYVRVGAQAHLQSRQDPSLSLTGTVISVAAMVDDKTRLVSTVVSVPPNIAARLLVGMTLIARIDLAPRPGIVIPRAALLSDATGTFVMVVGKGVAKRHAVAIALETDNEALIAQGLKPGEQVAIDGVAGLADGMRIRTQ